MHAFETTGTVDAQGRLALDRPLPIPPLERVRMIVLLDDQSCVNPAEHLNSFPTEPSSLSSYRAFFDAPETQDFWEPLADIFVEDPEEDWTQLLRNARRKSYGCEMAGVGPEIAGDRPKRPHLQRKSL